MIVNVNSVAENVFQIKSGLMINVNDTDDSND